MEPGSLPPYQSAVVTGRSLIEEVEMPKEKNDKTLAKSQAVSLSDLAQAIRPLVETWSDGETERTKMLTEATERSEIREVGERRWQLGIFGALPLVVVLFLIAFLYLKNRSAEASDLLKIVVSLAGGASVGYGIGYSRGKREQAEKE